MEKFLGLENSESTFIGTITNIIDLELKIIRSQVVRVEDIFFGFSSIEKIDRLFIEMSPNFWFR